MKLGRLASAKGNAGFNSTSEYSTGGMGIGDKTGHIINGDCESIRGMDRYAEILFKSLSCVAPVEDKLEVGISTPTFASGRKKAKVKTASGPLPPTLASAKHCTIP
jgi:hypothetical protein